MVAGTACSDIRESEEEMRQEIGSVMNPKIQLPVTNFAPQGSDSQRFHKPPKLGAGEQVLKHMRTSYVQTLQ